MHRACRQLTKEPPSLPLHDPLCQLNHRPAPDALSIQQQKTLARHKMSVDAALKQNQAYPKWSSLATTEENVHLESENPLTLTFNTAVPRTTPVSPLPSGRGQSSPRFRPPLQQRRPRRAPPAASAPHTPPRARRPSSSPSSRRPWPPLSPPWPHAWPRSWRFVRRTFRPCRLRRRGRLTAAAGFLHLWRVSGMLSGGMQEERNWV